MLPYLIWEQPRFRQQNDLNCFFQQTTPTRPLTKNLMLAEHEILIFLYFKTSDVSWILRCAHQNKVSRQKPRIPQ